MPAAAGCSGRGCLAGAAAVRGLGAITSLRSARPITHPFPGRAAAAVAAIAATAASAHVDAAGSDRSRRGEAGERAVVVQQLEGEGARARRLWATHTRPTRPRQPSAALPRRTLSTPLSLQCGRSLWRGARLGQVGRGLGGLGERPVRRFASVRRCAAGERVGGQFVSS